MAAYRRRTRSGARVCRGLITATALATAACDGAATDPAHGARASGPAEIVLRPEDAAREGAVQKKWHRWVVWCGHAICDGSYTWAFAHHGRYQLLWQDVKHKCAGASPYALFINGDERVRSKIPKHGPCDGCTPQNIIADSEGGKYGRRDNIDLGSYRLQAGDRVKLWVQNAFDCGIDKPGAYGGHFLEIIARRVPE